MSLLNYQYKQIGDECIKFTVLVKIWFHNSSLHLILFSIFISIYFPLKKHYNKHLKVKQLFFFFFHLYSNFKNIKIKLLKNINYQITFGLISIKRIFHWFSFIKVLSFCLFSLIFGLFIHYEKKNLHFKLEHFQTFLNISLSLFIEHLWTNCSPGKLLTLTL